MRLNWTAAALAVAIFTAPAVAIAEPSSSQPGASSAPSQDSAPASPEAKALVKRLFAAIHIDELMKTVMHNLIPMEADQLTRENPELTADQKAAIVSVVEQATDEWTPTYFDRMTSVYANTFSVEELKAMIDFYESPMGQSITTKTATLAPAATQIAEQLMPQYQALVTKHLCERLDCRKLKTPAQLRPS
jgi:hypothetical protein